MNSGDKNIVVGKPLNRVDGRLKVTGGARYAAEFPVAKMTYGVTIESAIAKGKIAQIDTKARVEQTYTTPVENHNPMEPHATTAVWQGDELLLYDATQGIFQAQQKVAEVLGIEPEKVRIMSYFVGGGFGCKG